jgi:hypothetical protein
VFPRRGLERPRVGLGQLRLDDVQVDVGGHVPV